MAKENYQKAYNVFKMSHNELTVSISAQYLLNDLPHNQMYCDYIQNLPKPTLSDVHNLVEKKALIDKLKNEMLVTSADRVTVINATCIYLLINHKVIHYIS